MNDSDTHNLDVENIQNLPEDLTGFVFYSTYSAAEIDTYEHKLITEGSNQGAYISSVIGGSLSSVSFEGSKPRNRIGSIQVRGVGEKIKEFSRVSRRNLLRKLASINRTAFRAFKGRLIFVTLTYPTD